MIRERQAHYRAKGLRAGLARSAPSELYETREVDEDNLRRLKAMRERHRGA